MNELQILGQRIQKEFPTVNVYVDRPLHETIGEWFLDITHITPTGKKVVSIRWGPRGKIFVADSSKEWINCIGPDDEYTDFESTFQAVSKILNS